MDLTDIGQYLAHEALGYLLAGLIAVLWYVLRETEIKLVAKLRQYADTLQPWQHEIIERGIVIAQQKFADLSGTTRRNAAVSYITAKGVPVNAAYLQVTYNALVRQGKLETEEGK